MLWGLTKCKNRDKGKLFTDKLIKVKSKGKSKGKGKGKCKSKSKCKGSVKIQKFRLRMDG